MQPPEPRKINNNSSINNNVMFKINHNSSHKNNNNNNNMFRINNNNNSVNNTSNIISNNNIINNNNYTLKINTTGGAPFTISSAVKEKENLDPLADFCVSLFYPQKDAKFQDCDQIW